jgi:stearoyl-CoA desaturase (delta-9 desaturase)
VKRKLHYENIFWITLVHLGAIAAIPFFSWGALGVCLLLLFTISPLGINLTYHRLLTHRSFKVPLWLEYGLATIAAFSAQGSMLLWCAEHRLHHRYSDTDKDPHSASEGFWHAHILHLFYRKDFEDQPDAWSKYVPDLTKHRYYHFLSKYSAVFVALPAPFLYWWGGISFVMWGIFVRIVLMWHVTWSVNSVCHRFGYRTFATKDTSTNIWWVGLFGAGEGWHNNHHAFPHSAAHGRTWYEFDLTWQIIRFLRWVGLATDVKTPVLTAKPTSRIDDAESESLPPMVQAPV